MSRVRLSRIFWIGAAAILVAAALVALVAVLRGEFSDNDGRILITLGVLLYTGAAALAGLALVDQGRARPLASVVVASAPVTFVLVIWAVWSFTWDEDGDDTVENLAWSAAILLFAGLLAATSLLLSRRPALIRLAAATGASAGIAASLSVIGVWTEPDSDSYAKVVAVTWILTGLGYLLVPVLQRFTSSAALGVPERLLAEIDGVELLATRAREGTIDPRLEPGERLLLRRRA